MNLQIAILKKFGAVIFFSGTKFFFANLFVVQKLTKIKKSHIIIIYKVCKCLIKKFGTAKQKIAALFNFYVYIKKFAKKNEYSRIQKNFAKCFHLTV